MSGFFSLPPAGSEGRVRLLMRLGYAVAAVLFARLGFDFGVLLGGAPMGFLMAANAAVFAWLMVGAVADPVLRLLRKHPRPPA